jgi:hypothetical protein
MARKATARSRTGMIAPDFDFNKMVDALNKHDSRTQRVAYYLNWAAEHLAYQYQPYNVIAMAISGSKSKRLPRMDSDEVLGIRRTLGGIRLALQRHYHRSLDVAAGGVRATVDSEDQASVVMPKKVRRLRSAKNSFVTEYKLINQSEITDPQLRAYVNRPLRDLLKIINSEDFDKKLLPPGGED